MVVPQQTSPARAGKPSGSPRTTGQSDVLIGFLTVVTDDKHGLFGGYLILNAAARPVEFHCSAPIKPNRAQELLYGTTLRPYLCGELIGATLLEKSKNRPTVILTDCADVLSARSSCSIPLALVQRNNAAPAADNLAAAAEFTTLENYPADSTQVKNQVRGLGEGFDLFEPFERIRLAIDEAQRGAQR